MMAISLTSQQQTAVNSTSSKILCLAGAGSGKSRVLVERAHRLASESNPESILCLTFTNAAAAEMRSRYKAWYSDDILPIFKTFHGYCYDLICKDARIRQVLGYSSIPTIPSDHVLSTIKISNLLKLSISVSEQTLKKKSRTDIKSKYKYDMFLKSVYKELISKNYITFDMMTDMVSELFEKSDASISIYKKRVSNILIDEFQDTSPDQWKFASSFSDADIFVVADERQAIYAFRGADSSITKSLFKDSTFEKILLDHNFRSTQQICDYANQIIKSSGEPLHIALKSSVSGPSVKEIRSDSAPFVYPLGSNNTARFLSEYSKLKGSTALLFRTNKEVSEAVSMLSDNNIKYDAYRVNSNDVKNYLRSIIDDEFAVSWLSDTLPNIAQSEFIRLSNIVPPEDSRYALFRSNFATNDPVRHHCQVIDKLRLIYNSDTSTSTKMADICAVLNIKNISEFDENMDKNIECLIDSVENPDSNIGNDSQSLYVGTIHSAKGLEWDNVFLWNVNCYSFKLKSEEDWNLYYVGATRAKQNLFVFKGENM